MRLKQKDYKIKINTWLSLVQTSFKLLLVFLSLQAVSCKQDTKNFKNTKIIGEVFGTYYAITYDGANDYERQFDSLFTVINKSMSTYIPNSDISKLNRNETVEVDAHFMKVFNASKDIYRKTEGAFDPTIGAVVNAWSFGPEGTIDNLDSLKIKALMHSVGLNKIGVKGETILKQHLETRIDFNAIAKGYALDVIGEFLESKDVNNYLVDIGGEIRSMGQNVERKTSWKVGVERPRFDGLQDANPLRAITLKNESMATSGTYRKFKIDKDGNRYAHIIDTKTGYPSKTNVLSVSVIAKDCMTADAYATAFQAMGIDKVTSFLKTHPELKVFLIFENDTQKLETLSLNDFPD